MTVYNEEFYKAQIDESMKSAQHVIPALFRRYKPNSVIDIGCGMGCWLKTCLDQGATDIQGFDGDYVNRDRLLIPADRFRPTDVSQRLPITRRYDLAITLEVAEHLPQESAEGFVEDLTKLSDVILFSAAIPLQGGTGHVNENWPEYWGILFRRLGYVPLDFLRQELWQEHAVCWWYRQNVLVFVKESRVRELFGVDGDPVRPLTWIHPNMYMWAAIRPNSHVQPDYHADILYYGLLIRAWLDGKTEIPSCLRTYGQEYEVKF